MKNLTIFALIQIFFFACQERKLELIPRFTIEENVTISKVTLSYLGFDKIEYIPLETTNSSLIPRAYNQYYLMDKIIVQNENYILKLIPDVYKFRGNGSFIAKIGRSGRGPEEYQTCHDVESDENTGDIYIVDGWKKKLFRFDEDGTFSKVIPFPFIGFGYFIYRNGTFLCYFDNHMGNIKDSFVLTDTSGVLLKSFPNKYQFHQDVNNGFGYYHETLMYRFEGDIFIKEVYSDTVFILTERNTFEPHIILDAGGKNITVGDRASLSSQELTQKFLSPSKLFEFGDFIYYEYRDDYNFSNNGISFKSYGLIGSKKDGSQLTINTEEGFINDLDGGPSIKPVAIKNDNGFIALIEAIELKNYLKSDSYKNSVPKYPEKKLELEKLASALKETDNPVLILVTQSSN